MSDSRPLAFLDSRFTKYVRPYAGRLVPVVLLSLVGTALSLVQPFLSKVLVDRALIGRDLGALFWVVGGFLGLTAASLAVNVFSGLRYTRVSAEILFDMRLDVFRHLQRLSPRYFAATPIGQIASRINSDIAEIQRVSAEVALAWIGQVVYLAGSVVMLVLLDARLFLVGLLALPAAIWALVRYRRSLEGSVALVRDRSAGVGTFLIEALQGMKLLVAHNAQRRSEDEFRQRNEGFIQALMTMRRQTYLSGGLPGVLLAVGSSAVFLYGGWRVIAGEITMGTLVAFAAYQMRLLMPVQGLMGIYASIASARVSLQRVNEILETHIDVSDAPGSVAPPRGAGAIDLENVHYFFDRGILLDGVTVQVAPRSCVAIIGASGGGKSTIADLLVRQADPRVGTVRLDGVDLKALPLAFVRQEILAVETDPFVFHASLAMNLRIAAPDATDAELHEALQAASLGEWVAATPTGLETVLGERGRAMSSGERQRLALARAWLANPRVLILDEATSALDASTEAAVFGAMRGWLRERTVVLITHRPQVAGLADRAIVLEGGRIVDDGVPAVLASSDGPFARLFAGTATVAIP
ncbi:MAG: ABC transporter ATP-binding protein [Cytophagaceae bacterium]|nr:ABC transporter ATP-binding protein [Gemmatimonadaceae bacterium]